jgi:hypothetical protein
LNCQWQCKRRIQKSLLKYQSIGTQTNHRIRRKILTVYIKTLRKESKMKQKSSMRQVCAGADCSSLWSAIQALTARHSYDEEQSCVVDGRLSRRWPMSICGQWCGQGSVAVMRSRATLLMVVRRGGDWWSEHQSVVGRVAGGQAFWLVGSLAVVGKCGRVECVTDFCVNRMAQLSITRQLMGVSGRTNVGWWVKVSRKN